MPNIEIHGFDCPIADEPKRIREKIKELFRGTPFFGEIATEIVLSSAYDLADNPLPYLRVWDTQEPRAILITNILRMHGFRVERPVVLDDYVEPPMWNAEEIATDLCWILRTDWLGGRVSGTLMATAIENLQNHEYEKVAEFYCHITRELLDIWSVCRPLISEIQGWVASAKKKVSRDEKDPLTRLVMLIQIIFSLMPEWNINTIFPAD